jgi:DTW domain-containing protein YfiP
MIDTVEVKTDDPELRRLAAVARCIRCCLQRRVCICDAIPSVAAATRVVILRHASERAKASNTARLAALALARCELRDWGAGAPTRLADLAGPGVALLFPTGGTPWRGEPLDTLVVLDGSWTQVRRMWRRIDVLRALPFVSLVAPPPRAHRLRRAPDLDRVSTIEAIAAALEIIEGEAIAAPLLALYDDYVERSRRTGRGA